MYYLESENLVHRDISYTNILLRSQGKDTKAKQEKRREIMDQLGLSNIESLRNSLNCREGLLIDFDYASSLDVETRTGKADASNVNESRGESQVEHQGSIQSSSQGSGQGSGQAESTGSQLESESREDFELVDDEEDTTVIQRIDKKYLGKRTVSYF
jgi:serine/threonine protein kinase